MLEVRNLEYLHFSCFLKGIIFPQQHMTRFGRVKEEYLYREGSDRVLYPQDKEALYTVRPEQKNGALIEKKFLDGTVHTKCADCMEKLDQEYGKEGTQ